MKIAASEYLFLLAISIIISIIYGRKRNIGITWSIIFSIFCSIAAIPVILLSKKKDINNPPNNRFMWGIYGLILLFLKFAGDGNELNITKAVFESIEKLTLPYLVFVSNISAEQIGYFSGDNFFLILPFYFILRNYTFKNLS